jgi:hypothetical protein
MKALLVVFIIFALVGGFIYYSFPWLFHPFNHAVVEKDFIANIPTIFRTPGGNLELAGVSSTETFMSSDTTKFLNWNIPGATTMVIIKVPVIYRYHVPVLDKWDIQVTDNTCLICAPELRPTLPPAIQSEKMEIKTIEGPLAFHGAEQQAKLLQSLTPQLEMNAKDSTRLNLVREEARKTVAEFVQTWLLQRDEWGEKKVENIKVFFRGEKDFPAESLTPPVEMQGSQVQ